MASTWISYNDLAWTEDWLASPSDCEKETLVYVDLIKRTAIEPPQTLLHLGSGDNRMTLSPVVKINSGKGVG